jgi:hypothetical protein
MGTTMTNTTPGPERFAIIEIPEGKPPANSLLVGLLDMLMEQIPDSLARNAAEQRLEQAQINAAQVTQMQDGDPENAEFQKGHDVDQQLRPLRAEGGQQSPIAADRRRRSLLKHPLTHPLDRHSRSR